MTGSDENYWATTQLIKNFNGWLGDHQSLSSNTKGTKSMGIHFIRELKTKKAPTKTSTYNSVFGIRYTVADLGLEFRVCHVKTSTYNSVFGII
jgi:hypothetical protein